MEFTFINSAGEVAFYRSDAQEAEWTQEEMNLNCTFPYLPEKVIENGMTILFQDPASNEWQAYEVRKCTGLPGEYYQQIIAEDIAISELTDCHIGEKIELTSVTAENALRRILAGTGWNVGKVAGGISSGDISRGSVWQNVGVIQQNWNVYIVPRVTVNSDGISARYLDIIPSDGIDVGLRLSINKNVTDPCVIYDDTELYTALYGYGGTYTDGSGNSKQTKEYNFASVSWEKTADHPSKPAGQLYIEYPEMTALFGRRGKPRFGYYQNVNIKDPTVLLEKTWETLKQCCRPKISITGTVSDLTRLGYKDQPIRLHYMAIVELEPFGLQFYKQIIRNRVDLLDATKTLPEIGDYIPNIIYINRETENFATGGGKGGGRGGGRTKIDLEFSEYKTNTLDNGRQIELNAQHIAENGDILQQAGLYIDPETGVLIYAEDNENNVGSKFHVQADAIDAEVKRAKKEEGDLSSKLKLTADAIEAEVKRASKAEGEFSTKLKLTAESIDAEVKRATKAECDMSAAIKINAEGISTKVSKNGVISAINQTAETVKISASKIELDGHTVAQSIEGEDIDVGIVDAVDVVSNSMTSGEITSNGDIDCGGDLYIGGGLNLNGSMHTPSWKSASYETFTHSNTRAFMYAVNGDTSNPSTIYGFIASGYEPHTIHYLGY